LGKKSKLAFGMGPIVGPVVCTEKGLIPVLYKDFMAIMGLTSCPYTNQYIYGCGLTAFSGGGMPHGVNFRAYAGTWVEIPQDSFGNMTKPCIYAYASDFLRMYNEILLLLFSLFRQNE
jgi:hypothetical protein